MQLAEERDEPALEVRAGLCCQLLIRIRRNFRGREQGRSLLASQPFNSLQQLPVIGHDLLRMSPHLAPARVTLTQFAEAMLQTNRFPRLLQKRPLRRGQAIRCQPDSPSRFQPLHALPRCGRCEWKECKRQRQHPGPPTARGEKLRRKAEIVFHEINSDTQSARRYPLQLRDLEWPLGNCPIRQKGAPLIESGVNCVIECNAGVWPQKSRLHHDFIRSVSFPSNGF